MGGIVITSAVTPSSFLQKTEGMTLRMRKRTRSISVLKQWKKPPGFGYFFPPVMLYGKGKWPLFFFECPKLVLKDVAELGWEGSEAEEWVQRKGHQKRTHLASFGVSPLQNPFKDARLASHVQHGISFLEKTQPCCWLHKQTKAFFYCRQIARERGLWESGSSICIWH